MRADGQDIAEAHSAAIAPLIGEALTAYEAGLAAIDASDPVTARQHFDKGLARAPHSALLLHQKAVSLMMEGRLGEAEPLLVRAAETGRQVSAVCDLGTLMRQQGRLEEAMAAYNLALSGAPEHPVAWEGLAYVHRQREDYAAAAACLRRGLPTAGPRRATLLCELIHVLQFLSAWSEIERLKPRLAEAMEAEICAEISSFPLLSIEGMETLHRRAARLLTEIPARLPAKPPSPFSPRRIDRLRIGYLSSDFYEHATARLIVEVLERHDREAIEVVLLDYGPDDGTPLRRRVTAAADRHITLDGLSFDAAAQRIREANIDILVDLKGNTNQSKPELLLRRPAPVLVHWLGYPGSLGGLVDAMIGDPIVTPAGCEADYDEEIVRLPVCYQPNDTRRPVGPRPTRAALGLPDDRVVFCGFNAAYKIGRDVWRRWMSILEATPGSVLWLQKPNQITETVYRREAAYAGVDPDRIVFAPWMGWQDYPDHLARHQAADLFLDASPYGAHTTASDALWAGLPALTFAGRGFAARVTASLLHFLDLDDLIAPSPEAYVERAIALAKDPGALAALRARLATGRTKPGGPFDPTATARALEEAYRGLYGRWAARDTQPASVSA